MRVISSGKVHDSINRLVTSGVFVFGVISGNQSLLAASVGLAIGTIWLSPDLDLKQNLPTKRLGLVKLLFSPYRKLCGHHRSIISHSPILSTFIRFAYVSSLPVAYMIYEGRLDQVIEIALNPLFQAGYIGLEAS